MSERQIIKIAVTNDAKDAIEQVADRYGMSQIEMASRLYRWFAEQNEEIQATILDLLPRSVAPDVARLVLKKMAAQKPKAAKRAAASTRTTPAKGNRKS
jgi:hypothetical protein